MKIMYFLETIAAIGIEVGENIQICKIKKLNEYHRSRSLFDPGQSHSDFKIKTCFSQKIESFGTKFYMKAKG